MAFQSMKEYTKERTGNFFLLRNDSDFADVIFLYRDQDDALTASAHYIKSAEYSGYVHCNGIDCPACAKNIRVQTKVFVPLYVLSVNGEAVNEIRFWDRNSRFIQTLTDSVFGTSPDPVNYVYRITRHGKANDINTTYQILAIGRNHTSYDVLLSSKGVTMPQYYESVCKELTSREMARYLNNSSQSPSNLGADYTPVPRGSAVDAPIQETPKVVFDGPSSNSGVSTPPNLPEGSAVEGLDDEDVVF